MLHCMTDLFGLLLYRILVLLFETYREQSALEHLIGILKSATERTSRDRYVVNVCKYSSL